MIKTVRLLVWALVLCAPLVAARASRSNYCCYKGSCRRPGYWLKGPTHTCRCHRSGRWYSCYRNSDSTSSSSSSDGPPGTIVEVAVGAGLFSTLVAAVAEADLVDALSGDGPLSESLDFCNVLLR